jgi:hypothetical protein
MTGESFQASLMSACKAGRLKALLTNIRQA